MSNLQQVDPVFQELFDQMQPEVKQSFTIEQMAAVTRAFGYNAWTSNHPLDLRFTLPIPGLRFYMVLIGGPERRSKERLQEGKVLHPLWTTSNILFFVGLLAAFGICMYPILPALFSLASSIVRQGNVSSPTSIPWIFDQSQCEDTGRTWRDGKCWDKEHNPQF
ncbi:hypothetical protein ACQFX9_04295 [Aliinostoc sp. HNIBRCY26]|uniref:hypothetical protein n=1 Tax=Aliinostoc sp. HNIBRCY26 TaxID=3418997 RepID=UPI003CFD03FD